MRHAQKLSENKSAHHVTMDYSSNHHIILRRCWETKGMMVAMVGFEPTTPAL